MKANNEKNAWYFPFLLEFICSAAAFLCNELILLLTPNMLLPGPINFLGPFIIFVITFLSLQRLG
jgi:hypothetical protein